MKIKMSSKLNILEILLALMQKFGKNYCFPSQYKILELLKTHHGVTISRRALNYHLRDLEDAGLIDRKSRIRRGPRGELVFNSSLYFLKKLGYAFLNKIIRLGSLTASVFRGNKLRRDLMAAPRITSAGPVGIGEIFKNLIPV